MIVYDSKKWSALFTTIGATFKQSYNLKQLAKFMSVVTIYATGVTIFSHVYLEDYDEGVLFITSNTFNISELGDIIQQIGL